MKLNELLEQTRSIVSKNIIEEDFPTIASFLEGNPIAKDVVDKVMDLIWHGQHANALSYLEKNHQDIKDQVMTLVYLQPHIAAKLKEQENENGTMGN
jgi:hypothetical protein